MTSSANPPTTTRPRPDDTLVIHQLSDLAFDQNEAHHPLFDYFRYLDELEEHRVESAQRPAVGKTDERSNGDTAEQEIERPERPPDLVIITGNITSPKVEEGWRLRALREAAAALRGSLESARRPLSDAVFVVPGTQDISWELRPMSLGPFAEAFSQFATPTLSAASAASFKVVNPSNAKYVVHLLNTCYSPAELLALPRSASKEFEDAIKAYEKALVSYEKQQRKSRGRYDSNRDRQLIEKVTDLVRIVAGGRIPQWDYEAFARACNQLPAGGDDHRLKILVTYHPLLMGHEFMFPRQTGPTTFSKTLETARQHGFHLAFHGHGARPQAFAELPLETQRVPLRQIGSPSLHVTRSYNEIVASRNPDTHHWRIDMRAISLPPQQGAQTKPTYVVLNPLADVIKPRALRKDEATLKHEEFEKEIRITLRLLAEAIESDSEEIPYPPLSRLRDVIQDVIFAGFDTLVGLAIKTVHASTGRVELQSQYIDPEGYGDDRFTHPFAYPTTPPAWALVLERILSYPRDFGNETDVPPHNALSKVDVEWLNATDKYGPTKERLSQYVTSIEQDHELPEDARVRELARAKRLYEAFAAQPATLHLRDTIQRTGQTPLPFDEVIYVPIPRRPRGGFQSARTEIGTLIIEVTRKKAKEGEEGEEGEKQPRKQDAQILTEERRDMLRTVSDVMYLILSSADRLGRPKGSWPHPRNGFR